jgi:hypothetical protein
MEQRAFLTRVVQALEQGGIAYAVTGSWASTTYGRPRTTHGLDVALSITVEQAAKLARAFPPPIYADAVWMQEAAALGQFFNIIDPDTGVKVDFWPQPPGDNCRITGMDICTGRRDPIKTALVSAVGK